MRAIWSGFISFGLVNIPVQLYSAAKDRDISFRFLHKKDLSPIRYAKICERENKEIHFEEVVRGYEYYKDSFVALDEEDFEKVDVKKSKILQILNFVNYEEIDPEFYEKPYYLEPAEGTDRIYSIFREALGKSKLVAIGKYVIKNREHLGAIRASGPYLILDQMRYIDEIKPIEGIRSPKKEKITKEEVELSLTLIEKLVKPFNPKNYHDSYTDELKKIIFEKSKGQTIKPKGKIPEPTAIEDMMKMLRTSIEEEEKKQKAQK